MQQMIERVLSAITSYDLQPHNVDEVRVILQAMLEPDEEMIEAGMHQVAAYTETDADRRKDAECVWRAMIQRALLR